MLNSDDFIKRVEIILDYYGLSASLFADKIGVQRSSMSHLLSGRNKPSLDFILKIDSFFPEVDLYWLLNGKGTFPKNLEMNETIMNELKELVLNPVPSSIDLSSENQIPEQLNEAKSKELKKIQSEGNNNEDEIEKIIFFYKKGFFKVYTTNQL